VLLGQIKKKNSKGHTQRQKQDRKKDTLEAKCHRQKKETAHIKKERKERKRTGAAQLGERALADVDAAGFLQTLAAGDVPAPAQPHHVLACIHACVFF
jgi:hypothetical protein